MTFDFPRWFRNLAYGACAACAFTAGERSFWLLMWAWFNWQ